MLVVVPSIPCVRKRWGLFVVWLAVLLYSCTVQVLCYVVGEVLSVDKWRGFVRRVFLSFFVCRLRRVISFSCKSTGAQEQ